jgi:phosphoribosylamine--glycine ligase/phosphoribosylformylglycinamidine cyclo-ligase
MAARMEGSKAFSKDFMRRHDIPTAAYRIFVASQLEEAKQYIRTRDHKVVLKASGLAAGKGVLLPSSVDEAIKALETILVDRVFGEAGKI